MKIGIYGDSYADCNPLAEDSWVNQLRLLMKEKYGSVKIVNYAKGGSSLYFSYKNYLDTGNLYDLVIFLATEPHRYPIAFSPKISKQTHYITSVPHVEQIELNSATLLNEEEKLFLQNLKGWFNASNHEYNLDIADILLSNIESTHSNVIIYPCFTESFKKQRYAKYGLDYILHPMHSFWHRQLELFDIDPNGFTALEKPTLCGHLTPEFNKYFAKALYSKIATGKYDHSGFFDIDIEKPKTHYYGNWD